MRRSPNAGRDWGILGIFSALAAGIGYSVNDKSIGWAVAFGLIAFVVMFWLMSHDGMPVDLVECPNCKQGKPRGESYCIRCGHKE